MEENNESGWKAFWGMMAIGIVIWFIFGCILRCAGFKGGDHINDAPWEPRHTQVIGTSNSTIIQSSYC